MRARAGLFLAAADHVGAALFHAALGVVLGAAVCGRFEVVVVLPSIVAASFFVLVLLAVLARRAGRRLLGSAVVRGARGAADELTEQQPSEPSGA